MITRLTLERFGRFRRTVFELAPVTVLFGPNEAGKTTFFDGLFQALCRPGESKKAGRLLKERYGPGRIAEAEFSDGGSEPVSDDEFLNLYAIRAGDLRLEMNQGTGWLERLKARLFLGGVDPSALAAEFEKRASDSRTLVHNKELERAREEAAKAGRDLDARLRERESLLARETSLADAEARLGDNQRLRMAAQEEAREIEADLAFEEKRSLRGRLSDQLARLEKWESAEAESLNPAAWGAEAREEWNRLQEGTRAASEAVQAERGRRDALREAADRARAEWRALRETMDAAAGASVAAMRMASEARLLATRKTRPLGLPGWNVVLILAFLAVGIAGGLLLTGLSAGGMAALAALSAGAALIIGRRNVRILDRDLHSRALIDWKAQWMRLSRGISAMDLTDGVGEVDSVEGFLRFLEAWELERKGLEEREAEACRRLESISDSLEKSGAHQAALREEEERWRGLERVWLSGHAVATPEEFLVEFSRRRQALSDLPRLRLELEAAAPGGDLAAYRRDLVRRLRGLDEEGVPATGVDEARLGMLLRRRQDVRAALEDLELRERELIAGKEGLAGEIRGALGKMAGEIVECEDRLAEAEARIRAMELDKKAAALALDIFRGLGDGADSLLEDLALEVGSMLGRILPGERSLSIPGLDVRRIQAMDAGGSIRSLDHLSTGTQDAVVLAARLALALKHRGQEGILVLDDPFLAMDDLRETRALRLLLDFHVRHGWQIILLTMDGLLRDKAMALFPNPSLVDLGACA